ncbi:MAG: hypothetical protein JW804_01640 [Sedimentisphaerales bacterium]|nr:hypothetical protein [Sedimentisphaerales bacterium]
MKFQVFKDGKVLQDFDISGAYLFGTDGIAVRRVGINFSDGVLECGKQNSESAALVLLWPVKGFGRVLLPTTCLPEKDTSYNLNVELARGRFMQIINKCEDWAFFEEDGLGKLYEQAKDLFIKAVQNISDMPKASILADEALEKAFVFGEQIALFEADKQFRQRGKERSFGRGSLGCKVNPVLVDKQAYLTRLLDLFSYAVIPVNWAKIEAEKGKYDFSEIEKCVQSLRGKRIGLGAGPLLRFDKKYLPQWLIQQKPSFEKIRERAYRFISEIVGKYSGRIRAWTVISGLNSRNFFGFNFEQTLEMTRAANMAVKSADPRIRKIVEVERPWGQYYAVEQGTIPPLVYMDMVVQSGVNFDAFSLKMAFDEEDSAVYTRDMMQISALLDYLKPIAKSFHITGVGIPPKRQSGQERNDNDHKEAELPSDETDWLTRFYKTVLSKPFVNSVVYSNLADSVENQNNPNGLLNDKFEPKPAFHSLKEIQKVVLGK